MELFVSQYNPHSLLYSTALPVEPVHPPKRTRKLPGPAQLTSEHFYPPICSDESFLDMLNVVCERFIQRPINIIDVRLNGHQRTPQILGTVNNQCEKYGSTSSMTALVCTVSRYAALRGESSSKRLGKLPSAGLLCPWHNN